MVVQFKGYTGDFVFDGDVLVSYKGHEDTVNIPEGCRVINSLAFNKSDVKSVVIPKSVQTVKCDAFNDCKKLSSVILNTYPVIEYNAFRNCHSLKRGSIYESESSTASVVSANYQFIGCTKDKKNNIDIFYSGTGAYFTNTLEVMEDVVPIDIISIKEIISGMKEMFESYGKKICGCILTCENGFGTLYCQVEDDLGFFHQEKVLTLSENGDCCVCQKTLAPLTKVLCWVYLMGS